MLTAAQRVELSHNGTPPRLWGKLVEILSQNRSALPVHPHACGENVQPYLNRFQPGTVHPHACGENTLRVSLPSAIH